MKDLPRKVDSSQAFTVVEFILKLQGEFMIKNPSRAKRAFQIINYFIMDILYTIAFWVQLRYVADLKELLDTLPIQTCSVVCAIKLFMIFRSVPELIEVKEIFDQLNSRPMNEDQKSRMQDVNAFCRKLTKIMQAYYCSCNLIPETSAFLSHGTQLIYPVYIPYDWKATSTRFYSTLFVQFWIHMQLVIQALATDVLGPLYMNVVNSHLEVNLERFANLNEDPKKSEDEIFRELIECIEDHRKIMRAYELIQKNVSHTVMVQFVGSIISFSTWGLYYLKFSSTATDLFAKAMCLLAQIIELLPFCYYSEKFSATTDRTVFALFSSNWAESSLRFRKILIIFMQMTQKKKVVYAGKQIPVTLATFASTVKAMYSVMMLLASFQN